jgi:WD40 repeat protein
VKNLYIYPDGIVDGDGKVGPGPRHWAHTVQSPVDIKNMINSTTLCDGVRLFDIDKVSTCNHILLATDTNDLVLKVEFQFHENNQEENTTLHDPSPLTGHSSEVRAVTWNPDGSMIASGSEDNTIKLWDTQSGKVISTLSGHRYDSPNFTCTFDEDGDLEEVNLRCPVSGNADW